MQVAKILGFALEAGGGRRADEAMTWRGEQGAVPEAAASSDEQRERAAAMLQRLWRGAAVRRGALRACGRLAYSGTECCCCLVCARA